MDLISLVKPIPKIPKTQVCRKCNVEKAIKEFYKTTLSSHRYKKVCKLCENLEKKEKYYNDKNK